MVAAMTVLLVYQLVGEIAVDRPSPPGPGPGRRHGAAVRLPHAARRRDRRSRRYIGRPASTPVAAVRTGRGRRHGAPAPDRQRVATDLGLAGGQHAADHRGDGAGHALAARSPVEGSAAMSAPLADIWVYLSAGPLLFLTLTLLVYQGGVLDLPSCRVPPAAESRRDLGRDAGGAASLDRDTVRDLFRRSAVRALPAGSGHGGAGRAAVCATRQAEARVLAHLRRTAGRRRDGARIRSRHRVGPGRERCSPCCRLRRSP